MKFLMTAGASPYNDQVALSLRRIGHTVIFVDDRKNYSLPVMQGSRMLWRFVQRFPKLRELRKRAYMKQLLMQIDSENPDMFFSIKGVTIRPEFLQEVRRRGVRSINWFPENAANEPYASYVKEVGVLWDYFLSFDSAILEQMPTDGRAKVGVLPFGANPKDFDPGELSEDDKKEYACDVCLVGAPYPERIELLSRIAGKVDLRIWGWEGWKRTPLARYYHGALDARQSAKAYRLAKISVNTNVAPLTKGANCRTFEIPASGGFQLTDEPADLHTLFEIGRELDVFHNPNEFEKKVAYWLEHNDERVQAARSGLERVTREHTLDVRMKALTTRIDKAPL